MTEPNYLLKQQPEDVRGAFVTRTVAFAIVVSTLAVIVSAVLLGMWRKHIATSRPPGYPVSKTVAGIHQTDVRALPDGLRSEQAALKSLGEYRYVGGEHEIARIPIERAMDWLVEDAQRGMLPVPDPGTMADAGTGMAEAR
jgi:hypothetical protein